MEVFVHGALCVAYSGQCLTSEALGGRSANRGECAQACRMPYQIVCDGRLVDLENIQYLLSPQDLAAYDLVPRLIELGVASLKIEGRLKTPEYVANITRHYRDGDRRGLGRPTRSSSRRATSGRCSSRSRAASRHGFLDGNNHKVLVRGDYAKKRGIDLGVVESITGAGVRITVGAPVKPGDGLVFDGDESTGRAEQGGRVYEVISLARSRGRANDVEPGVGPHRSASSCGSAASRSTCGGSRVGQRVWKTDDPELTRRLRRTFEGPPSRKVDLDIEVVAMAGEPLRINGPDRDRATRSSVVSDEPLAGAEIAPPTNRSSRRSSAGWAGRSTSSAASTRRSTGEPMVPMSLLNQLAPRAGGPAGRGGRERPVAGPSRPSRSCRRSSRRSPPSATARDPHGATRPVELAVLCRRTDQIEAAVARGIRTIYADYQDIKEYDEAVAAAAPRAVPRSSWRPRGSRSPARPTSSSTWPARGADGILVRNAGGMRYCSEHGIPFVADFSMNAANPLTVDVLRSRGALRVTASYDLNVDQLLDLLDATPPSWLEVVIHQRIPMFHMEHCVFCAFLSPGTDATNCGRPCDQHDVKLRDRVGAEHPLTADVGCRNTLFNAVPQTAAEFLPRLVSHGARQPAGRVPRRGREPRSSESSGSIKTPWRAVVMRRSSGAT